MDRNHGLLAGTLVVLALLGASSLPNKSSESHAAEGRKSNVPSAKTTHASNRPTPYSACSEIAKRLQRFVTDARTPVESWQLPDSCYEPGQSRAQTKTVRTRPAVSFAIATAPDPVSTHLSLSFDRIVESTQQAAQDDNYSYDSSWFPWDETDKDYPLLADQQAAEEMQTIQQMQPGVMLFRQALHASPDPYGGGLVIFIVGEQPTGGIRDDQFANALAWIQQLAGADDPRPLRILGPTFSGSLPSLQLGLQRYFDSAPGSRASVFVSSGTVSSPLGPGWFRDWLNAQRPESRFWTATENDSIMVNRFCQYLHYQKYPVNHIAFLSEDQTAFGRGTPDRKFRRDQRDAGIEPPCYGSIELYYPRDIATLRSAYQRQSVLSAPKPASSGEAPSTTLRGDLSEPSSSNHDTLRRYGGQLTALAQEAILLDIVNRLGENDIEFIVIRSTNSLDQIFLSEFLRRFYPQGRVVIDGADLLFNRGAEGRSLRGVMTLSTYPLLAAEQAWTPSLVKPTGGYRTFGEDTAEAAYIAARELLRDCELGSDVSIHDYAPPAWVSDAAHLTAEDRRPATWIGVIGRRQIWPLAVLNSLTLKKPELAGSLPTSLDRGDGLATEGETNPLRFPTGMWMLIIACCGWSWCHVYFCRKGSMVASPRALAYFAPTDRRQHPALIALGSGLMAMIAVTVTAASGLLSLPMANNRFEQSQALVWLAALAVLLTFVGALVAYALSYRTPVWCTTGAAEKNTKRWRQTVARFAALGLVGYTTVQALLLLGLTPANRIPMYWRSVHLLDGVSPLVPELLLLAGSYLWFWCALRGLAHFGDDRPQLPMSGKLPQLMPMFSWDVAGVPVEDKARPLTREYVRQLLGIVVITTTVCAIALRGFWVRTLGERAFGSLLFGWICLIISVILADGIQMWRAWSALRQLLIYLDRLPLRRTLRSLKGLAWGSIWKISGNVLEERYRVISLQIESLRHLSNTLAEWRPKNEPDARGRNEVRTELSGYQTTIHDFATWYVNLDKRQPVANLKVLHAFQEELAATAGAVMTGILIPAWQKEKVSLIFDRPDPGATSGDEEKTDTEISTDGLLPHVRAAEEFFVLPYLAFIQNMLGRFRTIALGMLWLFLGVTLAVSSYPFDPLNVLGAIFLAVFVIVGGVTILVYSQMSRDATLSHITNTKPGQLGFEFWLRLVGFGIGPAIGLLSTLFPSIADFALSWVQPSVAALK
jgi:hypothetical protein